QHSNRFLPACKEHVLTRAVYTFRFTIASTRNGSSCYWEGIIMEDCTALAIVEQPPSPAELTATLELAADFAKASKAKATQAAYESDFRIFESWCRRSGLNALPATPATLCAFLADEASAGRCASTLGRRLAAIRYFHRSAGHETPTGDEK